MTKRFHNYMQPASRIIEMMGGEARVAKITGVSITAVRKWRYPKDKQGTCGLIPARHQVTLLDYSRKHGMALRPYDFFVQLSDAA